MGYVLAGSEANEYFGRGLSRTKGDFNKDGYYDLLVTSWFPLKRLMTKVTVFFGSPIGLYIGFTILHKNTVGGDFIGDVNNDGIDDIILCSNTGDSDLGPGKCYVIFGSKTWKIPILDLSLKDDDRALGTWVCFTDNMTANTVTDLIGFGGSFGGLLDIDNDGKVDFAIANVASKIDNTVNFCNKGNYYVITNINSFRIGQTNILNKFTLQAKTSGFTVEDSKIDHGCFGTRVSALRDVNGDNINDFLVSADWENNKHGIAWVIFGTEAFPDSFSVDDLNTGDPSLRGFKITRLSNIYGSIGLDILGNIDINGDGIGDIILGERFYGPSSSQQVGNVLVIFGSKSPFPLTLNVEDLNGKNGFLIQGIIPGIEFGLLMPEI